MNKTKFALHVLSFLIFQVGYILAWLPLAALGHIVVPALLYIGLKRESKTGAWPWVKYSTAYDQYYNGFPNWAYIWSNEGDSVLGSYNYILQGLAEGKSRFKIAYTWSAIRNPVNNSRFVPPFNLKIDPPQVRWIGTLGNFKPPQEGVTQARTDAQNLNMGLEYDKKQSFVLFCWTVDKPLKANLLWQYASPRDGRMVKLELGWKVRPKDLQGFTIPYRASGAGNALISWKYI